MCLAFPGKIKELRAGKALVDYGSEQREVMVAGIEIREGDWVLVQQGFVVEKLSEEEARESLEAFKASRN